MKTFWLIWLGWAALNLAMIVVVIWVTCHFIAKFW